MVLAFAGSPEAAVPPLRALAGSRHEVVTVVTQPDKGRGRSRRTSPTPVAAAAEELGIPVLRPATINAPEVVEAIADAGAEALVVVAFGQILRDVVLSRWPCVNVHFSLLPAYRGAAPVERAIMDGVTETGVTTMFMEAGLDTGPILAVERTAIGDEEEGGALLARLSQVGGPLLVRTIDDLEAGRLTPVPQPEEGVSLAPKITAEDRVLDLRRPAAELARRVRALAPHIGATCRIDGEPFKVWRARVVSEPVPPGLSVEEGRLLAALRRRDARDRRAPAARARADGRLGLPARMARPARVDAGMSAAPPVTDGVARERSVALRVLRRVDDGAYADRALAAEVRRAELDPRARAQATRLAYGAVQRRRTLDWLIDGALDRPAALEPAVRDILRLGAYEIAFSDGVPAHAAVDQAVRQARALRGPKVRSSARAGVVNAVMRRLAADAKGRLAELDSGGAGTAALRHSMPDWIAERLIEALGEERRDRRDEGGRRARRVGPALEPAPRPARRARGRAARRLAPRPRDPRGLRRARRVRARVVALVGARPGDRSEPRVAAGGPGRRPGARRAHPRPLRRPGGQDDPPGGPDARGRPHHRGRAAPGPGPRRCATSRARMGAVVDVVEGDALEVPLADGFDAVLVDPPCTGLGVLSSRPDARWRRREESLEPLTRLQQGLLERAMSLVRPGGRVVYSTCTLIAAENEDVVRAVGAPLDDLTAEHPDLAHPRLAGALLTLPHRHGTDGFFIARMRRPGGPA